MTALLILGAILALLLLLLCSSIRVRLAYRLGDFELKVSYLFLTFDLSPEKLLARAAKQAGRETKKEYETQKREADVKADKAKGASDTLKTIGSLVSASRRGLGILRQHLVFYRVEVLAAVARPDAHRTALAYAQLSSFVAVFLAVLGELFVLHGPYVQIAPDFTGDRSRVDASLRVRIRPLFLIAAGLCVLWAFFRSLSANKRQRVRKKSSKGGSFHEPVKSAASHQ